MVELLVVIGILSILATGVITILDPVAQFQKAQDAKIKSDLSQIQKSLESYYSDNGKYPDNATSCTYGIAGNNGDANDCIEWGFSWKPYMNVLPKDSNGAHNYVYFSADNGQAYYLYANLNRGSLDPQVCQSLDANGECPSISRNGITSDSCGAPCDFGVSSPNVSVSP